MDDRDIYREEILEHYRHPQNFGTLKKPAMTSFAANPICGDQLTLRIAMDKKGVVTDVAFTSTGCALSVASASIFTEWMKGKTLRQLQKVKPEKVFSLIEAPITPVRTPCVLLVYLALKKVL